MSFHEAKKNEPRKNMSKSRTSSKYCKICGLHIRSNNHEDGSHHKTHHA